MHHCAQEARGSLLLSIAALFSGSLCLLILFSLCMLLPHFFLFSGHEAWEMEIIMATHIWKMRFSQDVLPYED